MAELTNEEIREKLLGFNYDCGPVTDTTRDVLLKKLKSFSGELPAARESDVGMTDDELRSQLVSYGVSVAPITSTNRRVYLKRLEACKKSSKNLRQEVRNNEEWEPMDVD